MNGDELEKLYYLAPVATASRLLIETRSITSWYVSSLCMYMYQTNAGQKNAPYPESRTVVASLTTVLYTILYTLDRRVAVTPRRVGGGGRGGAFQAEHAPGVIHLQLDPNFCELYNPLNVAAIDVQNEAYGTFAGPRGFNCICIVCGCTSPSRCRTGM